MAEETGNTQQAEGNSETNPSTQAVKNETPLHEHPRFKEVIAQKNEVQKQLSEYQAKEKAKEEDALKEKGEFTTLLAQRDATIEDLGKKVEGLSGDLNSYREGLVSQVPEERRYVTEGMSITNLQKFVSDEQTSVNAGKTDPSRAGTTAKGDFGGYSSKMEWVNKDPEGYEKAKKNAGGDKFGDMFMPRPNPLAGQ